MKKQIYLAATLLAIIMCTTSLTNAQQSWSLTGNASLSAGNFLGTTTQDAVIFRMSNVERMRIHTNGLIGIGTATPLSPLDISNSTETKTLNIKHILNTNSANYANYSSVTNNGAGLTYAYYCAVAGTGNNNRYGLYAQLSGTGTGKRYGSHAEISNTGSGEHGGYYASLTGTGTGNQYGARISVTNTGSGSHYGVYSFLSGSGATSKYGVYSAVTGGTNDYAFYGLGRGYFSDKVGIGVTQPSAKLEISSSEAKAVSIKNVYSGSATKSGIFNEVNSAGSGGIRYGIYNSVSAPSPSTSSAYGIYSKLESGSGIAWGILSEGSNTSNADAYGIYATASSTGSSNSCYGVRGFANSSGSNCYGVYGKASGANFNYGVYGSASDSPGDWAGYFDGLTYIDELRIGSTRSSGYMVSVDGKIICEELRVENSDDWGDYVFEENYPLRPLEEVEQYIKDEKHLPGIPSACEVEENGLLIGDMQKKMMVKIEELTLYVIELKKENNALAERLAQVETKN